jgi:hypothetical protein
MEIRKVLVTPEMAEQMLEKNKNNRKVRYDKINQYAKDMLSDRFREDTGELIKLSTEGDLLDGQHRLLAIVKANKPYYFHIAYGLKKDIFSVIDSGTSRSASDVFKINNSKNSALAPAVIQKYNYLKAGIKTKGFNKSEYKMTNDELLDVYNADSEKWNEICNAGALFYRNFNQVIPTSTFASFYAIFMDKNTVDANNFLNQFSTGQNVENGVIYLLRNRLTKDRMSINKLPQTVKDALIIKAWNCFRSGKTPKNLAFNPETDTYPIIL